MARGKKFDAAEKHFYEKTQKMRSQLDDYMQYSTKLRVENSELKDQICKLQNENEKLSEWISRLLEYTELSIDDIKAACEKDKKVADALSFMSAFTKYL